MRVEFINKCGGKMFVDEARVEEYKAAGHKLAADSKPIEVTDTEPQPKKRRKKEV